MSGFLQRLAAQAMGNASTLRSSMSMPYTDQPSPGYEAPGYMVAATDTSGGNEYNKIVETVNYSSEVKETTSSPEILVGQPASGFSEKKSRRDAQPLSLSEEKKDGEERSTPVDGPISVEGIEAHTPKNNPAVVTKVQNKPHSIFFENSLPLPLLSPQNVVRSHALNAAAVVPRGDQRSPGQGQMQVEETTEVHVSIGRIEVTAVHDAPLPKRQAPAAPKPMSLDEYLVRRKKEA